MSYGFDDRGRWGFSSVKDWFGAVLESFPAPWSIDPLAGKYYGTVIRDGRGVAVLKFWDSQGPASERQIGDMDEVELAEFTTDCHWESAVTISLCREVVCLRNEPGHYPDRLRELVFEFGMWHESVLPDLRCGGPNKRRLRPGG
jgi:hypothetical protein